METLNGTLYVSDQVVAGPVTVRLWRADPAGVWAGYWGGDLPAAAGPRLAVGGAYRLVASDGRAGTVRVVGFGGTRVVFAGVEPFG